MELLAPDLKLQEERVELLVRDLYGQVRFLERHISSMVRGPRAPSRHSETAAGPSRKQLGGSKSGARPSERCRFQVASEVAYAAVNERQ
jgi:hypothetical protein